MRSQKQTQARKDEKYQKLQVLINKVIDSLSSPTGSDADFFKSIQQQIEVLRIEIAELDWALGVG
jgi:hypothetical protein